MLMKNILFRQICHSHVSHKAAVRAIAPQFKAPSVIDSATVEVSLDQFKGKYLVMLFYPFDFTFVCPTELISFSDSMNEFKKLDTNVLGVSTDSIFSHKAWLSMPRKQGGVSGLTFPLVSDFNKSISKDFGFLVEESSDKLYGASLRGLAIIDNNSVVRHLQVTDASVGRNVEEVLRVVEALQFADKNGEVCPANWKKGNATIKPTAEGMKEFASKTYN